MQLRYLFLLKPVHSTTAQYRAAAFAVSILAGGLLYRHATRDATFRALTGSQQFPLSPFFMIAVALTGESILRCFFSLFEDRENGVISGSGDKTVSKLGKPTSAGGENYYGGALVEPQNLQEFSETTQSM